MEKALLDATHRRQLCSDQLPSWTLFRVRVYQSEFSCWCLLNPGFVTIEATRATPAVTSLFFSW